MIQSHIVEVVASVLRKTYPAAITRTVAAVHGSRIELGGSPLTQAAWLGGIWRVTTSVVDDAVGLCGVIGNNDATTLYIDEMVPSTLRPGVGDTVTISGGYVKEAVDAGRVYMYDRLTGGDVDDYDKATITVLCDGSVQQKIGAARGTNQANRYETLTDISVGLDLPVEIPTTLAEAREFSTAIYVFAAQVSTLVQRLVPGENRTVSDGTVASVFGIGPSDPSGAPQSHYAMLNFTVLSA